MFIKIHRSYRTVVALCDSNLLGKKFEEEIKVLDIRESFYKGEEMSKENIIKILIKQTKEDATFNIVGEESISTALESGIIDEQSIGKVSNIPYALKLI
jgi:hypothetical protein